MTDKKEKDAKVSLAYLVKGAKIADEDRKRLSPDEIIYLEEVYRTLREEEFPVAEKADGPKFDADPVTHLGGEMTMTKRGKKPPR